MMSPGSQRLGKAFKRLSVQRPHFTVERAGSDDMIDLFRNWMD
jgi:hypothetical protein